MDDKEKYILDYLEHHTFTDILDSNFVDGFLDRFPHTRVIFMSRGANKIPSLSRTLKKMVDKGVISRSTVGISSYSGGAGWPKWVYSYEISTEKK